MIRGHRSRPGVGGPTSALRVGSRYVWTLEEIRHLSRWGDSGWFYGLVRNHETGRVRLCEVYGGLGYAYGPYLRHPKSWWWAINDVRVTPMRKALVDCAPLRKMNDPPEGDSLEATR